MIARRAAAVLILAAAFAAPTACQEKASPPAPLLPGGLRMTVFEHRLHGLAIALEMPSGAIYFVDTGQKEDDADAGKEVLAPFLKARGVEEIAGILISHPHRDHFEGAGWLLKHFKVKSFIDAGVEGPLVSEDYGKLRRHAAERGAEVRSVRAGDALKWDEAVELSVLAPPRKGVPGPERDFLNNNSIVLRLRHGKNVILLPGDIEAEGRDTLLDSVPAETLKATVLVAPHHGFFTGRRFAETVRPETVIVSCLAEYSDRKPHVPGRTATDLYGGVGAKVYVTGWHGTVEVVSDGVACTVRPSREKK